MVLLLDGHPFTFGEKSVPVAFLTTSLDTRRDSWFVSVAIPLPDCICLDKWDSDDIATAVGTIRNYPFVVGVEHIVPRFLVELIPGTNFHRSHSISHE